MLGARAWPPVCAPRCGWGPPVPPVSLDKEEMSGREETGTRVSEWGLFSSRPCGMFLISPNDRK